MDCDDGWWSRGSRCSALIVLSLQVTENFAYSLLANYTSGDEDTIGFLEKYDIYIIPNVNPDGE